MSMQEAIKRIRHAQENNLTELDLSGLGITELPKEYKELAHKLDSLNVSKNNLTDEVLKTVLDHTKNLKSLNIADGDSILYKNKINRLGLDYISRITTLESLNLNNNNLSEVDFSIFIKLKNIRELKLDNTNINESHMSKISNITTLSSLDISKNSIDIDGVFNIESLSNLKELYISNNKKYKIGLQKICNLFTLTHLDLSDNYIDYNEYSYLKKLKELTYISLSGNKIIDEVLSEINCLTKLSKLNLSNNQISHNGISKIKELTHLIALNLNLNNVRDTGLINIALFTKLEELHISNNYITENGLVNIQQLKNLLTLNLNINNIKNKGIEYISKLSKLNKLYVRNNQIDDGGCIYIEKLKKLEYLYLSYNEIKDYGLNVISNLINLKHLEIRHCKLTDNSLIKIHQLTELKKLDISSNYIFDNGAIEISKLKKLLHIDISTNLITNTGLKTILLNQYFKETRISYYNNAYSDIPKNILDNQITLQEYFKQQEIEHFVPNNSIRVVMCGNSRTGKSSLTNKLIDVNNEDYSEDIQNGTDGIRHKKAILEKYKDYSLNIWDFGGQDFFHATHAAALSKNNTDYNDNHTIFCLLWHKNNDQFNIDEEQNMPVDYWLGFIEYMNSQADIIIIQTNADVQGQNISFPSSSLIKNGTINIQPNQFHYLSLKKDCILKDDIHKQSWENFTNYLSNIIVNKAEKTRIPKSWKDIRDIYLQELIEQKISTIEKSELKIYIAKKTKNKIKSDDSFNAVLSFLKSCGYILYWSKSDSQDETLQNTVIIDIASFHNDIYSKILSNKSNNGEFIYDDELKLHISYLQENGIVFKKKDEENKWVAPQFLPKEKHLHYFQELIPLTLVIRFPYYLPRFLITKFIVKAYNFYPDKTHYWKYGCISCTKPKTYGIKPITYLTKIDLEEQTISIHIQDCKGKYSLLNDIFSYFSSFGSYNIFDDTNSIINRTVKTIPNNINGGNVEVSTNGIDFVKYSTLKESVSNNILSVKSTVGQSISINAILQQIVTDMNTRPKKIFFSYSRQDLLYRNELEIHFANLKRLGLVDTWHDGMIEPGKPWDDAIKKELEAADIFLCLVSPYFMNNEYIWNVELKKIEERINNAEVRVIPIFITRCDFSNSIISAYQGALNIKQILGNPDKNRDADANIDDLFWIAMEEHEPKRHNYYSQIIDRIKDIIVDMP